MTDCLGTDTLVELVEGRADDSARARIEKHAASCEHCRALLSSLARGDVDPGDPLGETNREVQPHAMPAVGSPMIADAIDDPLEADVKVGRYIILHALGAGGMGVVYAARDPELDRIVAVKVLRGDGGPSMQERLRREAKAMAQLAHPNVVAVHDVGAIGDRIFVAMEYVDGETLAHWLATPRTEREILDAYLAAGSGLAVAHAAGIVHRDFKPENVLVGKDGRVRVVDFGLARTSGSARDQVEASLARGSVVVHRPSGSKIEATPALASSNDTPISGEAPTIAADLTVTGMMLGTPYYMAPELYAGAAGDAKSDQFSFCVALFTSLYGERPFDGDTLDILAENVLAGQIREPAAAVRVSRRIRAAIRRGLAVDPEARFASIDALLSELEPPGKRVLRVAIPVAAVAAVAAGLVAWGLARSSDAPDQRCTGAAAAFAPAWNADRHAAIDKAFGASKLPYAGAALREVTASLDRYATGWVAAHTDACRATQILGDQTEAMLDRRMLCLARRRQDATALVDALAVADDAVVGRAVVAAASLPDVGICADVAALSQIVAPPTDMTVRAKIDALTPDLAQARARFQTGKYPAALELATKVATDARAIAYRPFEAEADLLQGQIERTMGRKETQATLEAAVWAAEAGRHDEIAARGWAALVFVVGYERADFKRGAELAQRASAAIARLGGNAEIEASLEQALGAIAAAQGKLDEAVTHFDKAVALDEKVYGNDHPTVASALDNLGMALTAQGHPDRALVLQERSLKIRERRLGADHPAVGQALQNIGNAYDRLGDYAGAEKAGRRALAIRRATLDANHPDVASTLSDLARAIRHQGRNDEALALDREAVVIGEKAFGPTNPTYAQQLVGLGNNLSRLGRHAEADKELAHAEAIMTQVYGPDHPAVAAIFIARASNLMLQENWRGAVALYERALPVLAAPEGSPEALAAARTNGALAYLQLHQAKRALPLIEAAAKTPRDGIDPANLGSIDFTYAQALWDSGGDRKRARELAQTARTELAAIPDSVAEVDDWLAKHR